MADYPETGVSPWDDLLKAYIDGILEPDRLDSPVAGLVSSVSSATRAALDLLYSSGGGGSLGAPFYKPEAYGAVGDGVSNDSEAVQAAIDAAHAAGGGIVLLAQRYACAGDITHKGVSVWGLGQSRFVADGDVTFTDDERGALVAYDNTFRYVYGTSGGSSAYDNPGPLWNVIIDGLSIGGLVGELVLAQSAQGRMDNCTIINSAADGLRLNGMCQNTLFLGNYIGHHEGSAIHLLQAATFQSTGGSTFVGGWVGDADKLMWSDTDGTNVWPHTTTFENVIFEQRRFDHHSIVHVTAGQLDFNSCVITRSIGTSTPPTSDSIILLDPEANMIVSVQIDGGQLNGGSGGEPTQLIKCNWTTGIALILDLDGVISATDATYVVGVTAGAPAISSRAEIRTSGTPNPTTHFAALGGALSGMKNSTQMPTWYFGPDNSVAFSTRKTGEAFHDFTLGERGQMAWWQSSGVDVGTLIASIEEAFGSMFFTGPWMFNDAAGFLPNNNADASGTVNVDALVAANHVIEFAAGATVNVNLLNPSPGRFVLIGLKGNGSNTLTWGNPIWWGQGQAAPRAPQDSQWLYVGLMYAGTTAGWRELFRSAPTIDQTEANRVSGAQEIYPREHVGTTGAQTNGLLRLTYFTAYQTQVVNSLRSATGATAAVTPTLAKMGLYQVESNGDLTRIAITANDTTLWTAASTRYSKALTAPVTVQAGKRYAFATLSDGAATAPTVASRTTNTVVSSDNNRLTGSLSGQTDIPASITAASVVVNGMAVYGELVT